MTDLGRPFSDDVSSSQSEDFNRAHAEKDPSEVHNGDTPEDSSYSPNEQSHSDKEAEKTEKSALLKSWTGVFKKWKKTDSETHSTSSGVIKILPNGTRCSPPVSPLLDRKQWNTLTGDLKPNYPPGSVGYKYDTLESELTSIHPAEYYAEKLEVYQLKYSYLKSWPGLLRLLSGLQMVFGGMVFACVCAYIQRDSEWTNYYRPNYGLAGAQGYRYNGPLTAFVLFIVGLSWLLTVILLVLGLTMYYRTDPAGFQMVASYWGCYKSGHFTAVHGCRYRLREWSESWWALLHDGRHQPSPVYSVSCRGGSDGWDCVYIH